MQAGFVKKCCLLFPMQRLAAKIMLKRFSTTEGFASQKSVPTKDDLLNKLVRLIHQNGYARDKVVSDLLKRYLPAGQYTRETAEFELRKRFINLELEARTIVYLIENAETEIVLSRERAFG